MSESRLQCPGDDVLQQALSGLVTAADVEIFTTHLENCPKCSARAESLTAADDFESCIRSVAVTRDNALVAAIDPSPRLLASISRMIDDFAVQNERTNKARMEETLQSILERVDQPQESGDLGKVGNYRLIEILGHGGMGVVFRARDTRLHRDVALKVLLLDACPQREFRERFLREARTLATVHHRNVVTIFDIGEHGDVPWIAMELLSGRTLHERLQSDSDFAPQECLRIAKQVACGLAAIHEKGIVHRDLTPANIWLEDSPEQSVRILDFGLARSLDGQTDVTTQKTLTGTPGFLSPELLKGDPPSPRTDLFSFGCVLYRLCTGRNPFEGRNTLAVLASLANSTPLNAGSINQDIPLGLSELIEQLLAKEPDSRPESAAETLAEIDRIDLTSDRVATTRKSTRVSPRRLIWGILLLCAGLAFAFGPWKPDNIDRLSTTNRSDESGRVTREGLTATKKANALVGGAAEARTPSGKNEPPPTATPIASDSRDQIPSPLIAPFPAQEALAGQRAWAGSLGGPVIVADPVGLDFALIPPGTFRMGRLHHESEDRKATQPAQLTRPFRISTTEVPAKLFRRFVIETGYSTDGETRGCQFYESSGELVRAPDKISWKEPGYEQLDDHPVHWVSCADADRFCEWLSENSDHHYRLPTEAEWEYACRAGSETAYWWGETATEQQLQAGQHGLPASVGAYAPNAFGLFDTLGNVAEICMSQRVDYDSENLLVDPTGDESAIRKSHKLLVYRGGDYSQLPETCSASRRGTASFHSAFRRLGFRVVREIASPPQRSAPSVSDAVVRAFADFSKELPLPALGPMPSTEAQKSQLRWAEHIGKDREFVNSQGMRLTLIPPGGLLPEPWDSANRKPEPVIVKEPYFIGTTEVTVDQFSAFVDAVGHRSGAQNSGRASVITRNPRGERTQNGLNWMSPGYEQTDDFPAACLNQIDAVLFCAWLSREEDQTYRLPTEAEWEFAARAGTLSQFYSGNELARDEACFDRDEGPAPVASYAPNAFGLFDMHGNVREWCYDPPSDYASIVRQPLQGEIFKLIRKGVMAPHRGGCWPAAMFACTSSNRASNSPRTVFQPFGFRVVMVPDGSKQSASTTSEPRLRDTQD